MGEKEDRCPRCCVEEDVRMVDINVAADDACIFASLGRMCVRCRRQLMAMLHDFVPEEGEREKGVTYISISGGTPVARTEEVIQDMLLVDWDQDDHIVGIEILGEHPRVQRLLEAIVVFD